MADQQLAATVISSGRHQLERVYVAADARVKAIYEDNAVIHLTTTAESFVYVAPDGSRVHQLTDYCLHKYQARLLPVLAYRNKYACDVPRFCPSFLQSLPAADFSSLGYAITDACWPSSVEVAFHRSLAVLLEDGSVVLHSLCGNTCAQLDLHGCRLTITCQLLVSYQPSSTQYHYIQHTQEFTPQACPSRWQPVLQLLQAIADNAAAGFPLSPAATSPAGSPSKLAKQQQQQPYASFAQPTHATSPQPDLVPDLDSSTNLTHFMTVLPIHPDVLAALAQPRSPLSRQNSTPLALHWSRSGSSPPPSTRPTSPTGRRSPSPPPATSSSRSLHRSRSGPANSNHPSHQHHHQQRHHHHQQQQHHPSRLAVSTGGSGDASNQQQQSRVGAAVAASYSCRPWWTSQTLVPPAGDVLTIMWTPEAAYMFDQVTQEVTVWLAAGDSAMVSQQHGTFMQHYLPGEDGPRGYVSTCPPEFITLGGGTQRIAVGLLVAAAYRFRNAMVAVMAAGQAASSSSSSCPADLLSSTAALVLPPPGALLQDTAGAAVLESAAAKAAAVQRLRAQGAAAAAAVGGAGDGSDVLRSPRSTTSSRGGDLKQGLGFFSSQAAGLTSQTVGQTFDLMRGVVDQDTVDPYGDWVGRPLQPAELQQGLQLSDQVVEQQEVEGVGEFTAYADGRIKVKFLDRTILWMEGKRQQARLLLPDGSWCKVLVQNPLGVEAYVQAAWEFAAWAFQTPAQRAHQLRMEALVQAELDASARMATLCEWAAVTSRPKQRAMHCSSALPGRAAASGTSTAAAAAAAADQWAASVQPGHVGIVPHHEYCVSSNRADHELQLAGAAAWGHLPEAAAAMAGRPLSYREREVLVGQALDDTQQLLQRL